MFYLFIFFSKCIPLLPKQLDMMVNSCIWANMSMSPDHINPDHIKILLLGGEKSYSIEFTDLNIITQRAILLLQPTAGFKCPKDNELL